MGRCIIASTLIGYKIPFNEIRSFNIYDISEDRIVEELKIDCKEKSWNNLIEINGNCWPLYNYNDETSMDGNLNCVFILIDVVDRSMHEGGGELVKSRFDIETISDLKNKLEKDMIKARINKYEFGIWTSGSEF